MAKQTAAPLSTEPKTIDPTRTENDNLARMSPASRRAYIRLRDKMRTKPSTGDK